VARGGLGGPSDHRHGDTPVSGRELLVAAIRALPVPTAPPERSSRGLLGLHLIQSALRLEHVDRVREKLTLVDATHIARHIDIDVNVDKLPDGKEGALTVGGRNSRSERMLWVPIGRHPRQSLGPVSLRDADGKSLTRVTSRETNRLLASGMIQLMRLLINTDDAASVEPLRGPNRVSRWLLEAALLALVEDGRNSWPQQSEVTDRTEQAPRNTTLNSLRALFDQEGDGLRGAEHAYCGLLATLTTEQVILAMLPSTTRQLRISYEAPELGARPPTRGSRVWLRSRDFTARYVTTIPADVDSFHVTVAVPDDMEVRHFMMVSDADQNAADVLRADIGNLAGLLEPPTSLGVNAGLLARFEAEGIQSRLAEISRRRAEDLNDYVGYLYRLHERVAQPPPRFPTARRAVITLADLIRTTPGSKRLVSSFQRLVRGTAGGPDLQPDGPDADALRYVLERVSRAELGKDLHLDNDPRESAGHIQWRRHATGLGLPSDQEVKASVFLSLGDSSPSAAVQVLGFTALNLLLVAGLIFGTAYVGTGQLGTANGGAAEGTGQSEVLVTLLLLIPGILLSRFDRAPRRSVLSRIRRWPRRIAWLSVIVNSLLALWVVVSPTGSVPAADSVAALTTLSALALLVTLAGAHVLLGFADSATLVPPYVGIPAWLRNEVRITPLGAVAPPSVTFAERAGDVDV